MSDTTDDMEAWSGFLEDEEDKIANLLNKIINCKLENFDNEKHQINYMKKLARIALYEV